MEQKHDCTTHSQAYPIDNDAIADQHGISQVADTFKVLGDRTRMNILFCLKNGQKNVCTIAMLISSTHSNTSHQLKVLKDNRIVDYKKIGKEVFYFLADKHITNLIEIAYEHINHDNCDN